MSLFPNKISRKMYLFSNRPDYTWIDHVESTHTSCTARVETVFSGDPVTSKQMARPFHILHDHIKQTRKKHFACTIISTHWPSDAFRFCPYSMAIIRSIRLINQSSTVPESAITLHCSRSFVKGAPTFLPSSSSTSSLQLPPINPAT